MHIDMGQNYCHTHNKKLRKYVMCMCFYVISVVELHAIQLIMYFHCKLVQTAKCQ